MRRGSGSVGWPVPKTPVVPGSNLAISNFYKEHKFPFNYKRQKHNEKGCKSSPFFNMTKQRLQDKMFISIFDGTFPPLSLSISLSWQSRFFWNQRSWDQIWPLQFL